MRTSQCKVFSNGTRLQFEDRDGDLLDVSIQSTGETVIVVKGEDLKDKRVLLTNRAAHELRDFLNRRFPNATEVQ